MSWAQEEFGASRLGDERRVRRLVQLAADATRRPSGTVAGTFKGGSRREAAFRLVENDGVDPVALAAASHCATAQRCAPERTVIVPIDTTALSLRDPTGARGFGPIGARYQETSGIFAMTALAVRADGETLGVLAQRWWVRSRKRTRRRRMSSKQDPRPREARESFHWVRCLRDADSHLRTHAPTCRAWYQIDRAGDCLPVLAAAVDEGFLVTTRAQYNRRLARGGYLHTSIVRQPVAGYYEFDVPERPHQQPRRARLAVRFFRTQLSLPLKKDCRRTVWMNLVYAKEIGAPPGQKPLKWMLLTNAVVETLADALRVVEAYTFRWRVEEFHKTWKSGACGIESSLLRAPDHLIRWATVMAAVAARIERIKHRSREQPDLPASVEYSQDEIDATILLRKNETRVTHKPGDVPTLGEVTRWIADLGGYMGSKKSPPPGSVVLRRGLEQVAAAAVVIRIMRDGGDQRSG
jgi:hypothetical protein